MNPAGELNASLSNPLRIAFCLPNLEWLRQMSSGEFTDAAHIQQGYIAQGLQARGHTLSYVASRSRKHTVITDDLQQLRDAPHTWSASRWFEFASKGIWRVQQSLGIPYLNVFSNYQRFDACLQCLPGHDVVHERNGLYDQAAAMACKRLGLPYVMFFDADQIVEHDFLEKSLGGLLRWRAREVLRYNLSVAECVVCVSEPASVHLMQTWRVPANKIVVFPNGVDVQRFQPCSETRPEVRASLGVNYNPLIIFLGNFYKWHDITTLLRAFARVMKGCPGARLVLVGDGAQRRAMMQLAADLGLGDSVRFTGYMPHAEVHHLLNAADVAVAPFASKEQDLWLSPMKLFEYMATGRAIIASALGQLNEVITDGDNGLLVPPGDVSALAAGIQRLISNEGLRSRLGRRAREDAVSKYSWKRYVARLERVYDAVIARRPPNLI